MILKDFIPSSFANDIELTLGGAYFPWYWNASSIYGETSNNETEFEKKDYQFTHEFFANGKMQSEYFNLVNPIILFFEYHSGIKVNKLFRVKANLTTHIDHKDLSEAIHTDMNEGPFITLLYYVNDSDGDTILYGDEPMAVTPQKGTAVVFKSTTKHRPTPPTLTKNRIVINMVLEIDPEDYKKFK